MNNEQIYYTYLLYCADDTIYCGYTNNITRRLKVHNAGKGAKYTRSRRPVRLAYYETFHDKSAAMRREAALKKLTHKEKLHLIALCQMGDKDEKAFGD